MDLRRWLGGSGTATTPAAAPAPASRAADGETATVRRIVAEVDALPAGRRREIAGLAYVLARVARADLVTTPAEIAAIERAVAEVGGLSEAQAVLVVAIAREQGDLVGGTEDFLVTRELARIATREERERVLRMAFAIGASDDEIDAAESAELERIGRELGFSAAEVGAIRLEHREVLSSVRALRAIRPEVGGAG